LAKKTEVDNEPVSYREIARYLSITTGKDIHSSQVHRIEKRVLRRLQEALEGETWVQETLEGTCDCDE